MPLVRDASSEGNFRASVRSGFGRGINSTSGNASSGSPTRSRSGWLRSRLGLRALRPLRNRLVDLLDFAAAVRRRM